MRRSSMPTVVTIVLSVLAAASAAQAQSGTRYYVCRTRDFAKRIEYVSPIFASAADFQAVGKAWGAEMTSKYGIQAINYYPCGQGGYATAEMAKQALDGFTQSRGQFKAEDIAWTYGGAKALTVADKPREQAAPANPVQTGLTTLTAAQRALAQGQVTGSAGWCQYNMHELRALFDCNSLAQAVLRHQLAHPEEWHTGRDYPSPQPPVIHDLVGGIPHRVDCAECLTDQRIAAYIGEMMQPSYTIAQRMKNTTPAKLDEHKACLTKTFGKLIRSEPYPDAAQRLYNIAESQCSGSRP